MNHHPVTLSIPQHVYDRARQVAAASSRAVEDVLLDYLESATDVEPVPPDEQSELDALTYLSDDALRTILREQMTATSQERMNLLMERHAQGLLERPETQELEQLVERGDRLMLRKAEAAALLNRRGYTITPEDMAGTRG
jgi:hypothetical protein